MSLRSAAIGLIVGLGLLALLGNMFEGGSCYVRLWLGTITGFFPSDLIVGQCAKRLLWPVSLFLPDSYFQP